MCEIEANDIKYYPGCPKSEIYRNVILSPQYDCLYTSEGRRINTSCFIRGEEREIITNGPKSIPVQVENMKIIEDKMVYLFRNDHPGHYGHFLTENISRLWFYWKNRKGFSKYSFFANKNLPQYARAFLALLKVPESKMCFFDKVDKMVSIKEIVIPEQSFNNRWRAYSVHAEICEEVARMSLKLKLPKLIERPLYLSRRLFAQRDASRRKIIDEEVLEKYLRGKGIQIVYLENMTLSEQIYLINSRKNIIAPFGSALHNILFALRPVRILTLTGLTTNNYNYLLMDQMKSCANTYVECLIPDKNCAKKGYRENFVLDTSKALKHIELWLKNGEVGC